MVWFECGVHGPSGRTSFEGHRDLDVGWVSVIKTLGCEIVRDSRDIDWLVRIVDARFTAGRCGFMGQR